MTDAQQKHLEIIQTIVERMASNQFLLRGWSVTLATAVVGFAVAKDSNAHLVSVALIPVAFFWGLDAYYLYQERLFRRLYDEIRSTSQSEWEKDPFSLDTSRIKASAGSWFSAMWAPSIWGVHLLVVLLVAIVAVNR